MGEDTCFETGRDCDKRQRLKALKTSPDGANAIRLFLASQTQMRMGFNGAIGFDYPAVERVAESLKIEFLDVLPMFKVIETAYLAETEKLRKAKEEKT